MADSKYPDLDTHELAVRRAAATLSTAQDEYMRAISDRLQRASYPGLHLPQLRNALCERADSESCDWLATPVRIVGSGPWDQEEFAEFLETKGFALTQNDAAAAAIVLGHHSFSEQELADLIASVGDDIPIYTQELLVLGLARQNDPYAVLEQEAINLIAEEHPAITLLLEAGRVWPLWPEPDTEEEELDGEGEEEPEDASDYEFDLELADSSPLHKLGYTARADGPGEEARHSVLGNVFSASTLPGLNREQQERWGSAGSPMRLRMMSSFLAWLIRLRGGEVPEARKKWLADLGWLHAKYYKPAMRFEWPQVPSQAARKRTPNAAFMKPLRPDAALAAVVGWTPLPRTEIVSKLWAYVKKNKLQDTENKRLVNADDKLRTLFGKDQVSMFEMAGLIGKHVR